MGQRAEGIRLGAEGMWAESMGGSVKRGMTGQGRLERSLAFDRLSSEPSRGFNLMPHAPCPLPAVHLVPCTFYTKHPNTKQPDNKMLFFAFSSFRAFVISAFNFRHFSAL
jgi:hypothetical protein